MIVRSFENPLNCWETPYSTYTKAESETIDVMVRKRKCEQSAAKDLRIVVTTR